MLCQGERAILETRSVTRASSCSTPIRASSPSLAGWDCSKPWGHVVTPETATAVRTSPRLWLAALIPLALLAALLALIVRTAPADRLRGEGAPPVERLAIERAVLGGDGIAVSVLNDGPDPVTIAQVMVDDAYWAFTSDTGSVPVVLNHLGRTRLAIPYPWVEGEAHLVKLVTLDWHDVRARDSRCGRPLHARTRGIC